MENEWKLTKKEINQLKNIGDYKVALAIMAEAQFSVAQKIARAEKQWWDDVAERLKINRYELGTLKTDIKTGKITESL